MTVKIEIDGDSEEAVALALLQMVARAEGKADITGDLRGVDRVWVLDTYAECLEAVLGERMPPGDEEEDDDEDEEDEDEEGGDEDGGDEDGGDEDGGDQDEADDARPESRRAPAPAVSPILDPTTGLPIRTA